MYVGVTKPTLPYSLPAAVGCGDESGTSWCDEASFELERREKKHAKPTIAPMSNRPPSTPPTMPPISAPLTDGGDTMLFESSTIVVVDAIVDVSLAIMDDPDEVALGDAFVVSPLVVGASEDDPVVEDDDPVPDPFDDDVDPVTDVVDDDDPAVPVVPVTPVVDVVDETVPVTVVVVVVVVVVGTEDAGVGAGVGDDPSTASVVVVVAPGVVGTGVGAGVGDGVGMGVGHVALAGLHWQLPL